MRKHRLHSGLWFGLLLVISAAAPAQNTLTSRALAMGGAFTAIAEGDGGVNWNPAAAADQTGRRFAMPNFSLLNSGAGNVGDLIGGIPTNWNDRFALIRKWAGGTTDFDANAFTGYAAPGFALSVAVEGSGQIVPYDANGIAGHAPLSANFTLAALQDATNKAFTDIGLTAAQAAQETAKVVANIQKNFPGASTLLLPVYKSRVVANADAYGAGLMTMARTVKPGLRVGINFKMVAAAHVTDTADFGSETFAAMAARVTGGIASPALVDRVLKQLNLRNTDGTFFSGDQLAGSVVQQSGWSGLEVRPTADIGTLWQATRALQLGLVMRNVVPARFNSVAPLNTHFDLGAAYVLRPKSLLAAVDLTNLLDSAAVRVNAGLEWRTPAHISLRTGLYRGRVTFGAGIGHLINFALAPGMSIMSFGLGF